MVSKCELYTTGNSIINIPGEYKVALYKNVALKD